MEGPRSRIQPGSVADCGLYGSSETTFSHAECVIEPIPVWFTEDENVDVSYGTLTGLPFMPGGPRSVDVGLADASYRPEGVSDDGRNAKGLGQDVSKADIVRAGGVRPDEPGVSHLLGFDQAGLFSTLDLPIDRWMRGARPFCNLGEAELKVRISQQQRKDLALLLGAQDGQERRRRASIHV